MTMDSTLIISALLLAGLVAWLTVEIRRRHILGIVTGAVCLGLVFALWSEVNRYRRRTMARHHRTVAEGNLRMLAAGNTNAIVQATRHYIEHLDSNPDGRSGMAFDYGLGCWACQMHADRTRKSDKESTQPDGCTVPAGARGRTPAVP